MLLDLLESSSSRKPTKQVVILKEGRSTEKIYSEGRNAMNLQTILQEKGLSMCHRSKASGVPNATVFDICSGKNDVGSCNAISVLHLSDAP